ncbi:MAG: MarR family transcriptional regulator [Opitutae bacterium]|nr:MarR family transcriptional regulator [Opitutae bacterium]
MARSTTTVSARQTDALLREVVRLYVAAQRSAHACCRGASGKECEALALLGGTGPITVQEFADQMGLEKTWASRLAVRLEKRGVVKRVDHPDDGRSWLLELTPKGRAQCGALNDALDGRAVAVLSHVPAGERAKIDRALGHLRDALRTCCPREGC